MASHTIKTKAARRRTRNSQGKERKRKLRSLGSTPPFPIHVPEHTKNDEQKR